MHLRCSFKPPVLAALELGQTSLPLAPSMCTLGYGALGIILTGPKWSEKELNCFPPTQGHITPLIPKAGREADALQKSFCSKNQD